MRAAWPSLLIAAVAASSGCRDLDEFNDTFTLSVVGASVVDDAGVPEESFIRRGIPAGVQLAVTFNSDELTMPGGPRSPGTLTSSIVEMGTSVPDDVCATGRLFDATPMQPIEPLAHDQLSLYEFPGIGRIRNHIFNARPATGPFAGRDVMVFVSLLRDAKMEVRLIAGSVATPCEPTSTPPTPPDVCARFAAGDCDLFALFRKDSGSGT